MPSTEKTMKVAICAMPDGQIAYVTHDSTAVNTAFKNWRESLTDEKRQEYDEAKVGGGVVVITMLCSEYFVLEGKGVLQ